MFGKPEWFQVKKFGWGLDPITWQGWVYVFVWVTILIAPFTLLLVRRQWIEAGIWIVVMQLVMLRDVYRMHCALTASTNTTAQEGTPPLPEQIETRNFNLERRS